MIFMKVVLKIIVITILAYSFLSCNKSDGNSGKSMLMF